MLFIFLFLFELELRPEQDRISETFIFCANGLPGLKPLFSCVMIALLLFFYRGH